MLSTVWPPSVIRTAAPEGSIARPVYTFSRASSCVEWNTSSCTASIDLQYKTKCFIRRRNWHVKMWCHICLRYTYRQICVSICLLRRVCRRLSPLMDTWQRIIIQQYGDWYTGSSWVSWVVTFDTTRRGRSSPSPLLAVPNVTAHQPTASLPYQLHIIRNGTIPGWS